MADQPNPSVSLQGRHTDIIAQLEKATGPDRELDVLIALAVGGYAYEKRGRDTKAWYYRIGGQSYERRAVNDFGGRRLPDYTKSLDASLALVGERLPGWAGLLCVLGTASKQGATLMSPIKETGEDEYGSPVEIYDEAYGEAATAPLAVLVALFKALDEQES